MSEAADTDDDAITQKLSAFFAQAHQPNPQERGPGTATAVPPVSRGPAPGAKHFPAGPPPPPPPGAPVAAAPAAVPAAPAGAVPVPDVDRLRELVAAQLEQSRTVLDAIRGLEARLSGLEQQVAARAHLDEGLEEVVDAFREELFSWLEGYTSWVGGELQALGTTLTDLRTAFLPAAPPEEASRPYRRFSG